MRSLLQILAAVLIVLTAGRCEARIVSEPEQGLIVSFILEVEHNWTLSVGKYRFGLVEVRTGADERLTTVYCGKSNFDSPLRAWTLVTIALGTVVFGAFAVNALRRRDSGEKTKVS